MKKISSLLTFVMMSMLTVSSAFAQSVTPVTPAVTGGSTGSSISSGSSLLPPLIDDLFKSFGEGGGGLAAFLTGRVQFAVYAVFGLIILVAIAYSVMAGIKYIRSEGDPGKIEEAQKSIKAILMGIASIFVAIVGIVLVYVVFGQSIVKPETPQVCLSAGGSVGCIQYTQSKKGADNEYTTFCEAFYRYMAANNKNAQRVDDVLNVTDDKIEALGVAIPTNPTAVAVENTSAGDYNLKTTAGAYKAIGLCIEPMKGGYIPKLN